ncbi:large ribosomal subunit protein mL38 isoform X2 [Hemitrygon akajei]|uniref:large ribosomal subunit protein mL38 isoform X2 n=1 Tax=Hemitrygon akajei TaxID=2704970 RepID=UPI003BF94EEB
MAALVRLCPGLQSGLFHFPEVVKPVRMVTNTAVLLKRAAPLGPMPNEDIDVTDLESLEKYRSYSRYLQVAEEKRKEPTWWRTFQQHIQKPTPEKIDIGLPHFRGSRKKELKERKRILRANRNNSDLERASRHRTLLIPLDEVNADWEKINGPYHLRNIGEHYAVFRDLFNGATFVPRVMLRVHYDCQDYSMPVYFGNVVTPTEATNFPKVSFEAEEGSLWTLLFTNPDGHLRDNESEYIHWLVFSLKMRTFKTFDFYKKHQDLMTPAGMAFFQSRWDESVTHTFHNVLNMKEPIFEYDFPPAYHPAQRKYPHGKPLRYLDRYRDSQEPTYGIY